jgi:two-component system cell cycle sensor histidine kinase/response regulator CckA
MPSYDGRSALLMAHARCPDIPYIFFSGTLGEEAAVQALRDGATDYVLKHKATNLIPAIKRALSEARERTERKRAEEELRKTEAQLRQSQKLEGIGQLAGGIAHDFNNLLTVINGYGELALQLLPPDHEVRPQIQQIREAGRRAAALTQQILAFSRKQQLNPVVFNMNDTVKKMETLLRRLIGEDITLLTTTEPKLWPVKADEGQIEQVIMNLAVNARDAMPDGGTLEIETRNVEVDASAEPGPMLPKPGAYVKLTVGDTGCGMDDATKARIFEPFFTTKGPDKGTGLGLATVYGIIHQSGGTIAVESRVQQGTVFGVYLPRAAEEAESLPEKGP